MIKATVLIYRGISRFWARKNEQGANVGNDAESEAAISRQFRLEEYRQLRAELLSLEKHQFTVEVGAIAAVAAIATFAFSDGLEITGHPKIGLSVLPLFVVLPAYLWSRSFAARTYGIGEYIRDYTESKVLVDGLGWEGYLTSRPELDRRPISTDKKLIWVILFLFAIAFAFLVISR
ncbi:MAG TPA: hypothetical protein VMF90_06785 [Rhizobiaceae bacterium]|nr:hypothetical protein [Rhizobiaceae bacterium]